MTIPAECPAGAADCSEQPRTRGAATREALLRAAGEQFAIAGYQGASLGNILVGAGVTKGALYFHFANKEALADAVLREAVDRKCMAARAGFDSAPDPLSGLVAGLTATADLCLTDAVVRGGNRLLDDPLVPTRHAQQNYLMGEVYIGGMLRAADQAGLLRPTMGADRDGAARPEVDIDVIARTIITLAAGHRLICERTDTTERLPVRMREMWHAVLPLIATDQWLLDHPIPTD
jgi:AcrR family transcriptional regulator